MTSGKLFNGCLIVLGIFVAIVFGLGYAFSGSESSTTEELFRMNARVQFKKTEQLYLLTNTRLGHFNSIKVR